MWNGCWNLLKYCLEIPTSCLIFTVVKSRSRCCCWPPYFELGARSVGFGGTLLFLGAWLLSICCQVQFQVLLLAAIFRHTAGYCWAFNTRLFFQVSFSLSLFQHQIFQIGLIFTLSLFQHKIVLPGFFSLSLFQHQIFQIGLIFTLSLFQPKIVLPGFFFTVAFSRPDFS